MHAWGLIAAVSLDRLFAICGVAAVTGGALVGLIFRGAATAWREERDAAVDKADRLDEKVTAQAAQIEKLKDKVDVLEKRTNYEAYAERSAEDHRRILDSLAELTRGLHANTTATEFLIKQAFPAATAAALKPS